LTNPSSSSPYTSAKEQCLARAALPTSALWSLPTCALQVLSEVTDLGDALHPLIHILLCLGHQVKSALCGLDVKHTTIWQLLLRESGTFIHSLTQAQVDTPEGLLGVIILVVFQNIWVTIHLSTPQDKPAFPLGLDPTRKTRRGREFTSY
jgi:hypothetical protein